MKKITSEAELNERLKNVDVLVCKWGANWCTPCRLVEQAIKEIEADNIDCAEFLDVDVDEADEDFVEKNGISGIPVLQFYRDGALVDTQVGLRTKNDILQKIMSIKF